MSIEQTLSIIKPDAVEAGNVKSINKIIQNSGLKIIKKKEIFLSNDQASRFYSTHSDKPFFHDLCDFMTSGRIIVQILEGENAIDLYRKIMGSTNPSEAAEGTIRNEVALSIQENSVHGSDSSENAKNEIDFFFNDNEIVG